MRVDCWQCGSTADFETVPNFDAKHSRNGKVCPTCGAPFDSVACGNEYFDGNHDQVTEARANRATAVAAWQAANGVGVVAVPPVVGVSDGQ